MPDMPSLDRFTFKVLGTAFRVYALVALPAAYGTIANHPVLAWYFVPLVLLCRFRVTFFGYLFVAVLSGTELWLGATYAPFIGLCLMTVFIAVCARKGSLRQECDAGTALGRLYTRLQTFARPILLTLAVLTLAVAVCMKNAPFTESALWSVCLIAVARTIPKPSPSRPRAATAATLALATFSWLIAASIVEIGARLFLPPAIAPSDMYMEDARFIFTLRPGGSGDFVLKDNDEKKVAVRASISSQGVRNRVLPAKTPREFRIVLLGDSYTMGHGIPEDQTIACLLEKSLRPPSGYDSISVVNCGVGGYAPWQERGFLNARGFGFAPDLVILQVFPANDVAGTLSKVNTLLEAPHVDWEKRLNFLRHQNEPTIAVERWLDGHAYSYGALARAMGDDDLAVHFLKDVRFWPRFELPHIIVKSTRNPMREASLVQFYPVLEEGYEMLEEDIRGIQADCGAHHANILAYAHPYPLDVIDDGYREKDREALGVTFELNKDVRLTNAIFDRAGIPHVDVTGALESSPNPEALYYRYDGHWTPQGADLVAKTLADFLLTRYFPEKYAATQKPE